MSLASSSPTAAERGLVSYVMSRASSKSLEAAQSASSASSSDAGDPVPAGPSSLSSDEVHERVQQLETWIKASYELQRLVTAGQGTQNSSDYDPTLANKRTDGQSRNINPHRRENGKSRTIDPACTEVVATQNSACTVKKTNQQQWSSRVRRKSGPRSRTRESGPSAINPRAEHAS